MLPYETGLGLDIIQSRFVFSASCVLGKPARFIAAGYHVTATANQRRVTYTALSTSLNDGRQNHTSCRT